MAMSAEHKAALAQGRRESRIIKNYLSALGARRPGRPVTPDSVKQKIAGIEEKLNSETDPLKRVDLMQARIDAEQQLEDVSNAEDLDALEDEFVDVASTYSDRKGISYAAWREAGVAAATLKRAGVKRTRRS